MGSKKVCHSEGDNLPEFDWSAFLSERAARRLGKFREMRAAVGDDKFDAWVQKRVNRRFKAIHGEGADWSARDSGQLPPYIVVAATGYYAVLAVPSTFGRKKTVVGRVSHTVQEAFASFYERQPQYAEAMRKRLTSKGYTEFGEPL